jgi:hypothetical protein
MKGKYIDLTGKKFGRLTVIKRDGNDKHRAVMWLCKCDCGKISRARGSSLSSGLILSCGCQRTENIVQAIKKHGDYEYRLYTIWIKMKHRCEGFTNEEKIIKNYRERGIKVCDEWHDYLVFKEWALSNGYADDLSIDRIDNNGNYCPENCRWSNSKTQTLKQWSDESGIKYSVLRGRIQDSGWPIEKAFTQKVGRRSI